MDDALVALARDLGPEGVKRNPHLFEALSADERKLAVPHVVGTPTKADIKAESDLQGHAENLLGLYGVAFLHLSPKAREKKGWPDLTFVIGGADGLDKKVRARANEAISLSKLTFPHYMVRVILAESLYRAWTIHSGHPYHRT